MDFADPDINLQDHSVPIEEMFQDDSSIRIYKAITAEILRVVFKGMTILDDCTKEFL